MKLTMARGSFRGTRRAMLLLVAVCSLAVSSSAATEIGESATSIDLSSYDGRWHRIDDGESDAQRLSAIDGALTGLSWIMRKMASGVLQKTPRSPRELEFVWDGELLHQGLQGKDQNLSKPVLLDGQLRSGEDPRGVPFAWAWTSTDSGIRVNWEQHQAYGSNLYRIDAGDGRTLIVQHTVNVTAISDVAPIVYLSRFSREDESGESHAHTNTGAR